MSLLPQKETHRTNQNMHAQDRSAVEADFVGGRVRVVVATVSAGCLAGWLADWLRACFPGLWPGRWAPLALAGCLWPVAGSCTCLPPLLSHWPAELQARTPAAFPEAPARGAHAAQRPPALGAWGASQSAQLKSNSPPAARPASLPRLRLAWALM